MLMEIRTKHGQLSRSLQERLEKRLWFALAKFGGRIRHISAFLEDINGPRGGEDQRCRIEVSLVPSGSIVAEATDAEVTSAIGLAAKRVARRIKDVFNRKRTKRTRVSGPLSGNGSAPPTP